MESIRDSLKDSKDGTSSERKQSLGELHRNYRKIFIRRVKLIRINDFFSSNTDILMRIKNYNKLPVHHTIALRLCARIYYGAAGLAIRDIFATVKISGDVFTDER